MDKSFVRKKENAYFGFAVINQQTNQPINPTACSCPCATLNPLSIIRIPTTTTTGTTPKLFLKIKNLIEIFVQQQQQRVSKIKLRKMLLNIPRLRDVLRKLETTSDLARSLIKRADVVIVDKEASTSSSVTSQSQLNSLVSQSQSQSQPSPFITTFTKITCPKPPTPPTGTNEIKIMIYKNNNNNNNKPEHEHDEKHHHQNHEHVHEQQQPKTIMAALLNASLFSGTASKGSGSRALNQNSRELNLNQNQKISHNMSTTEVMSAETNLKEDQQQLDGNKTNVSSTCNGASCGENSGASDTSEGSKSKPCFNSSLADILHFMELVGNLKHTKRTGWVLRDVNDCESISGHMYRMSMMTFLLEETESLNRIRCMELALVHDLAESLVGDLTPFCGVAKEDKKAMELKAMADICKLVEPRGKRIMELFEEYEEGQSEESKFVKDLDRLDMVMQAFEYEKRDNCLMKHQEFFDSTEGKFQHPFIKKLVKEICDQRKALVEANIIAKGELNLKTVTPNCPPCLEHKMESKNERS